jgi:Na+-driven multidrug efflux pump
MKKGQLSLVNIFMFVILIFVAIICSGIITPFVADQVLQQNLTGTNKLIVESLVTMLFLGIIITFFLYITPVRPQQY